MNSLSFSSLASVSLILTHRNDSELRLIEVIRFGS